MNEQPERNDAAGEPENLIDQLSDLLIYAPLGLALEARDLVPKLVERGRGQVALLRFASKVANKQKSDSGNTKPTLPIANYDSYSAADLIKMLATLTKSQLQAILEYEKANRNRQTVINRINQLLARDS